MTVRVRFAPSPTGIFHVGGARSALQNWIFAEQHDGVFVLRIEDTDASRNRPEWTDGIISALDWLGIHPGTYEGPYLQSSYATEQRTAALRLHQTGQAYYCDCTKEQVLERSGNKHAGYDGFCRDRGLDQGAGRALRFRTPDDGQTVVVDLIRGKPAFDNRLIEDFVIVRADGSPVFLLANVIDDIAMRISHVIRAEEHLSNTPKQQLLWQALGEQPPVWAHVPLVVNEKRQKLSKRRDKVALEAYRAEGYLAAAMRNYLMLLGWAPAGDREIVPWSVIETEFRLEDVNPSPAFFDQRKLRAFNGEYIRALPPAEFLAACEPWLYGSDLVPAPPWPAEQFDLEVFAAAAPHVQTRIGVLGEIVPAVDFLFLAQPQVDAQAWAKVMTRDAVSLLTSAREAFAGLADFTAAPLRGALEQVASAAGVKLGKAQAPVRVAITGRDVGLPLFESLELLGRERSLHRLGNALHQIS